MAAKIEESDGDVAAALEALAYQTRDVVAAFQEKMPDLAFNTLRVDGGAAQNEFLMQFQADILNMQCVRPSQLETTVLGVAALAGIMAGDWTEKEVARFFAADVTYYPQMDEVDRDQLYEGWLLAVKRAQLKG